MCQNVSMKKKKTFPVLEMQCAACSARVEKTLAKQEGVLSAVVNLSAANATIEYDDRVITPEKMREAIVAVGYDMVIDLTGDKEDEVEAARIESFKQLKKRTVWAIVLALPVAIIGMFFMHAPYASWVMWVLSTPVVFWLGRGFFINAWKQLKHGSANMDTLVANSTGIAYLFSLFNLLYPEFWLERGITPHVYFEAACVIIAFILLGRTLEARANVGTTAAIKQLMGLQPQTVTRLKPNGREEVVPISRVFPGDMLIVKPGEKIAVDGTVTEGHSYVDESMLSGEPLAVLKEAGRPVYAGTINQNGSFRFKAEKVGGETMLAQIIRLVQEAQGSKAPVQRLVDKIAAVFVPTVMTLALISFIAWILLDNSGNGFTHGLLAAVTVLIIACPCALGLATPTAITVAMGKGAECGILIKDAESLETAMKVKAVVLDKTGTLTEGKPTVADGLFVNDKAKDILFTLEHSSEHPLASAICQSMEASCDLRAGTRPAPTLGCVPLLLRAGTRPAPTFPMTDFESLTGRGVKGCVDGKTYYAGNLRLLKELGVRLPQQLAHKAQDMSAEAMTVVWLSDTEEALAVVGIADKMKPTSKKAVTELQSLGIDVYMLTGDNQQTAEEAARQVGINHFEAEMLPAQKVDFIKKLQAGGIRVAMVGDGINDSAALAAADLSVAMGQGSSIAMDVAKVTIISSDLTKLATAIRLSRQTVRTIRQNLFWAFIYNVLGIPIAAGVLYPVCGFLLNPMIAGAAMAMSSVSVVTNSLRLKRVKSEK